MMADPIVIELQRLASDGKCPVDELLRKALIVATKLAIEDFSQWINSELHGYTAGSEVPEYRRAQASLHVFNNVQRRLIPYYLPEDLDEELTRVPMMQPLADLVALAASESSTFQVQMPPGVRNLLLEGQGQFPMEPVMQMSRIYVVRALDAVRNTILEWSLRLEKQGILGEGMRFTSEEKAIAMTSQNIHINSFQGILGDVAGSTVTQNLNMSIKAGDFNSLKQRLTEAGITAEDLESLKEALNADPKPTSPSGFGPKVSAWIGTMMTKAASGAWDVTVATAGNLIPAAITAYYGLGG
ncbi:hypothetical protein [Planctomicrobium sp. SH664]|uniref:AbiTii domain-containing protein n=1 Tax=Planctomicrobium sp. SH664 TaxID=3448125 RepID=UPI003F5BA494